MCSSWFPFQYRDVAGWRADGLPLTASSDRAAQLLDALVAQVALSDSDPQLGGLADTMAKIKEAEPDLFLFNAWALGFEAGAGNSLKNPDLQKKLSELQQRASTTELSGWERDHLRAVEAEVANDLLGACCAWEDILAEHPKDMMALHLLFFTHLTTGRRRGLRDAVTGVAAHFRPDDRYHGNVHAKMCFGYEQNGQFDLAMKAGMRCMEVTPKDIWGIHSISHVYEETEKPDDGIKFLESCEADWAENGNLNCHVWWHQALNHVQKGDHHAAVDIYDAKIKPLACKMKMPFPLSDASALLLRLHMGEAEVKTGLDLKDRWRELAKVGYDGVESINNVFYDFYLLLAGLYGDDQVKKTKALDAVREQAALWVNGDNKRSFNCSVAARLGVPMFEAAEAFKDKDYEAALGKILPVRYEIQELLGGSHAQKDVVDQLVLRAAIGAGRKGLATQLINERRGVNAMPEGEGQKKEDSGLLNDRLLKTILTMH